jgi:5-methyltetrahydropteroyltriglutamate--homocysteine methyltransferase
VPDVDWLLEKIQGFVDSGVLRGQYDRVWVNPDCGLKTRRWAEVIPSLAHMVQAAALMRARLANGAAGQAKLGVAAAAAVGNGAGAKAQLAPAGNGCVGGACCH